jgi:hypothetical protein
MSNHNSHNSSALIENPITAAEIRYNISILGIQIQSIDSKLAAKQAAADAGADPVDDDWLYRTNGGRRWKLAEIAKLTLAETRATAPETALLSAIVAACREEFDDEAWAEIESEARAKVLA